MLATRLPRPAIAASVVATLFGAGAGSAQDYLQTGITDGTPNAYAEGVLEGYYLQDESGRTLCADPFAIGKYISCRPALSIQGRVYRAPGTKVWVETNGQLGARDVIDADGRRVCTGPVAWNQFRSPDSYITCQM